MPDARVKRTGVVSWIGLILAAVLYVAINALFTTTDSTVRIDVTEDDLYTLSNGTEAALAGIKEPVVINFFFSESLGRAVPVYAAYARRVRELLHEIAVASKGNVLVSEHNPKSFSDAEELAVSHGIQGIPLDQGGELAYFGLSGTNSVDELEIIAFFQPDREALLEYDLAQMLHTLSNPDAIVVGIMSPLPVMGDMQAQLQGGVLIPWPIANELRNHYELMNLPESLDIIPSRVDVMLVIHPQNMSERSVYALEQFLFRGGRAILFVDPKAESDMSVGPNHTSTSTANLKTLLQHWGLAVPHDELVADRTMGLRINAGTTAQPVPAEYLLWLGITPEQLSADDPVTSRLPNLNIATAGHIMLSDHSALTLEPLITSSQNSATVHPDATKGLRPDVLGILNEFKPDERNYVIAARVSGVVDTAFPGRVPPRTVNSEEPDPAQLKRSTNDINVIIIADSDLLEERFWLRKQQFFGREVEEKFAGNADFVLNAIGNLAGSDNLLKLRSRGVLQRPFETIVALERDAEQAYQSTERELQNKLKETQSRIAELQGVREIDTPGSEQTRIEVSLTGEQRNTIETLRREMLEIRKQLRDVQRKLREDVDTLESRIKFINIGLIPSLVFVFAIAISALRFLRRRRSRSSRHKAGFV